MGAAQPQPRRDLGSPQLESPQTARESWFLKAGPLSISSYIYIHKYVIYIYIDGYWGNISSKFNFAEVSKFKAVSHTYNENLKLKEPIATICLHAGTASPDDGDRPLDSQV